MKAIRYHEFGGTEVLRWEKVPDPTPATGETVVKVRAIAVSPIDWKLAAGGATMRTALLPQIPGSEAAGVTADGRRVVIAGGGHGTARSGVYAEKIAAANASLVAIPDGVGFAEAASLGVAYATAHLALSARAGLRTGESAAVLGATGGVGIAGVQIARLLGASRVVAACRLDAAEAVRALGADEVLDSERPDLGEAIAAAAPGGAHVILDPIAGAVGARALGGLAPWGRQVVLGTSAGDSYTFKVPLLYGRNASILGFTLFGFGDRLVAAMEELLRAVAERRLKVPIARTFSLARAADAWRYAQTRGKLGKVILEP
jgi:NADPH2:quinone reductase